MPQGKQEQGERRIGVPSVKDKWKGSAWRAGRPGGSARLEYFPGKTPRAHIASMKSESRSDLGVGTTDAPASPTNYRGEIMTLCKMQHIPLSSAYLCPDCNCIGNCAMQCPACASYVVMNLASVLDREFQEDQDERYSRRPALVA